MDCPQCRRECGQNDKFCSKCGYRLCSARTPVTDSDKQEGPEHPVSESQVHSDNHTHSDDHTHNDNHTHSKSHGHSDTGPSEDEAEEKEQKEKDKSQISLLESENQQTDTTPAEHLTPGTPAQDSKYQEETTDNRSSLGPEPAPETPSSCPAQAQPSSADPDKSDAKCGLADTATMDGTLSKDTNDSKTEDSKESVSVSKDEAISKGLSVPEKTEESLWKHMCTARHEVIKVFQKMKSFARVTKDISTSTQRDIRSGTEFTATVFTAMDGARSDGISTANSTIFRDFQQICCNCSTTSPNIFHDKHPPLLKYFQLRIHQNQFF